MYHGHTPMGPMLDISYQIKRSQILMFKLSYHGVAQYGENRCDMNVSKDSTFGPTQNNKYYALMVSNLQNMPKNSIFQLNKWPNFQYEQVKMYQESTTTPCFQISKICAESQYFS
jgi:hypothetical protein